MQIILRILLVNLFLISTSYAKVLDLAGVWFEPARAILFVIKTEHNQPLVTKVFTKNKDYCIADSANTESMRIKFQQAHKIDVIKDTMQLYELPTDYPNRVSTLFKLNTLPENCITSLSTKNPKINFDVLWNFYHSYYPAFKERLGTVTWRDLYSKYSGRITADMSPRALFNVMGDMLKELHDEHINL